MGGGSWGCFNNPERCDHNGFHLCVRARQPRIIQSGVVTRSLSLPCTGEEQRNF